MLKIINKDFLDEERAKKKITRRVNIFSGNAEQNLKDKIPETFLKPIDIVIPQEPWVNSAGYERLWDEIRVRTNRLKNAAQPPSADDLAALVPAIFTDISIRAAEQPDLTTRIAQDITNLEYPEDVPLRDIFPYIGEYQEVSGTGDPVPLIQQLLGQTKTVPLTIKGIGWKDSLANMLWNSLHTMQKVNQANSDADVDARNAATIGLIVAQTFTGAQIQAAVDIADQTFDENMYDTIRQAIKKLRALLDIRTDRKIAVPTISLLVNSADTWDIERVIRGQLNTGGGQGLSGSNRQALPIGEIIEYDQGITDGKTWGKKTLSFPGVTQGTIYAFVPREYFSVLNKRNMTMATSRGSALQLSTDEFSWYRANGVWTDVFLGNNFTTGNKQNGYGAIVEITLPTDDAS